MPRTGAFKGRQNKRHPGLRGEGVEGTIREPGGKRGTWWEVRRQTVSTLPKAEGKDRTNESSNEGVTRT